MKVSRDGEGSSKGEEVVRYWREVVRYWRGVGTGEEVVRYWREVVRYWRGVSSSRLSNMAPTEPLYNCLV